MGFYSWSIFYLQIYFTDMEASFGHPFHKSPPPNEKRVRTPPSKFNSNLFDSNQRHTSLQISEFNIEPDYPNRHSQSSHPYMQEQENEKQTTDRFIPLRKNCPIEMGTCFQITQEEDETDLRGKEMNDQKITVDQMYRCVLLDKNVHKILKFGKNHQNKNHSSSIDQIQQNNEPKYFKQENHYIESKIQKRQFDPQYRKISKVPFKVLDAPNLQDDFYLNLLQWSSQNVLSVALDACLYFWNANNNRVVKFCQLTPDSICSLNWNCQGTQIAIGTSKGTIETWDVAKSCRLNQYSGHGSRVSSVSWGDAVIASGSRDRTIQTRDVRQRYDQIISKYEGHSQEVCGLKWSFDNSLLASGGNDNKLFIWSTKSTVPICKFTSHCAAVKGIAWSPHNHGVLASGGGTADKTIKFWNTLDSTLIDSIDTGSQVCNLMFSKNTKEIVSTHGYSNNQIVIWKYPNLQKVATLTGHTSRVLFLAMSPSGQTIVTGAGDETLRFWNTFPSHVKNINRSNVLSSMDLR